MEMNNKSHSPSGKSADGAPFCSSTKLQWSELETHYPCLFCLCLSLSVPLCLSLFRILSFFCLFLFPHVTHVWSLAFSFLAPCSLTLLLVFVRIELSLWHRSSVRSFASLVLLPLRLGSSRSQVDLLHADEPVIAL